MEKLCLILVSLLLLSGCSQIHTHSWSQPDYQSPSTCSKCGATIGTALTADFEKHLISTHDLNEECRYTTICADYQSVTHGTVRVENYHIFKSDETHESLRDYSWQSMTLQLDIGDENSNSHGFIYNHVITDYYDIDGFAGSFSFNENKGGNSFTVNYNGKDYDQCLGRVGIVSSEWEKNSDGFYHKTITITWDFLLPDGYDGTVVGLKDSSISENGSFLDLYREDGYVLFRLDGIADE